MSLQRTSHGSFDQLDLCLSVTYCLRQAFSRMLTASLLGGNLHWNLVFIVIVLLYKPTKELLPKFDSLALSCYSGSVKGFPRAHVAFFSFGILSGLGLAGRVDCYWVNWKIIVQPWF